MTLRQWLTHLSQQLGDYNPSNAAQQFQHWPIDLLLSYYNEAACAIATAKPTDYIVKKTIKLVPGQTQESPCSVVGNNMTVVDCHGNYLASLTIIKRIPTWRGRACSDASSYMPANIYRADSAPNLFEIYPPVPDGVDVYVQVRCVESPAPLSMADLDEELPDCKYTAALTQWALFRALSGDSDTTLLQASAVHYKAFFDLLGIQMKAEAAFLERPMK